MKSPFGLGVAALLVASRAGAQVRVRRRRARGQDDLRRRPARLQPPALQGRHHEVVAEIGYDLTVESYVAPGSKDLVIHSARLFAGYTGKLTEDTGVLANVEGLFNLNSETGPAGDISPFEDTRINAKATLTTKLASHIDVRFAVLLKFDNAPAALPAKIPFAAGFVPLADTVDTVDA